MKTLTAFLFVAIFAVVGCADGDDGENGVMGLTGPTGATGTGVTTADLCVTGRTWNSTTGNCDY